MAEQVECCDELITDILSGISIADVVKMSTVSKRWRTLIFDPGFAYTHYKKCDQALIIIVHCHKFSGRGSRTVRERYRFRSYNLQTGKLSTHPFTWEGLDSDVQNGNFELFTASNGLMCFYSRVFCPYLVDSSVVWLYNPVRKISKKLSMPFEVDTDQLYLAKICNTQNTLKFVMVGSSLFLERQYTLVFDFHSNSWYEGRPPPLIYLFDYSFPRVHLFLNGVIYFVARVDAEESTEIDEDVLFRDEEDLLCMIVGYDVNRDQWDFSSFVPDSVGYIHCLTEWEGNLVVCASISNTWEPDVWDCDGRFAFWILDTEHKEWILEREINLSQQSNIFWKVSASSGVVCFSRGYDSVIIYNMKTGHCSTHCLGEPFEFEYEKFIQFVTFEPTLLSF